MAYSDEVLRQAKARLSRERQRHSEECDARIAAIYTQYPRLKEIDDALRLSLAQVISATFQQGGDPRDAVAKIAQESLALQEERSWILQAAELDESELEITPICPACDGTGYVGAAMCECLRELCRQEQKKSLSSLLSGKETFDAFDLQVYPDVVDPVIRATPRSLMKSVFERSRQYARCFSPASPSLLFSGETGLGKTFLSACIARTVADHGFSVVYDTVCKLISDFETVKFGDYALRDSNLTQKYLYSDLLIIDDLGTELTTQFSISALYQVINTRLIENRPTIISTNLSTEEIRDRYSPQIVSRLLGIYQIFLFRGNDIRMQKGRE